MILKREVTAVDTHAMEMASECSLPWAYRHFLPSGNLSADWSENCPWPDPPETHIKTMNKLLTLFCTCSVMLSETHCSHRLDGHLHSQVVIRVGTLQEVLQGLGRREKTFMLLYSPLVSEVHIVLFTPQLYFLSGESHASPDVLMV